VGLSVTQRDDASITRPLIPSLKGGEIKSNPLLLKALRSSACARSLRRRRYNETHFANDQQPMADSETPAMTALRSRITRRTPAR